MKRIPPRVRRLVYNKFDGHCAYCGKPIEFKDMQVDHIKPALHRWSDEDRERWAKGHYGDDSLENYNPACRPCNFRKGTLSIEGFREALEHQLVCLEHDFTYRMAKRYGLVEEHPHNVVFYFEQH